MSTDTVYMYITNPPDDFWMEDYTKYITTLEGFSDMLVDILANEDDYLSVTDNIQYTLSDPDDEGRIKITISGTDCFGECEVVERGLIPVNFYD